MNTTDQRAGLHPPSGDEGVGAHPAHLHEYEPAWYRAAQAERDLYDRYDIHDDGDFGAIQPLVSLWAWILKAWLLIAAIGFFCWMVMT